MSDHKDAVSRRELFHIIGSVPAVASLAAGTALAQGTDRHPDIHAGTPANEALAPTGPYQYKAFNAQQWKTVRVLCDLIIPSDERSGSATQAGVPEFIDDWLRFRIEQDGNDNLKAQVLGGLMWLDHEAIAANQKPFAESPVAQQKALLDRIAWPAKAAAQDRTGVQFFNVFRDLTVSGFFSSKMGVRDLPYLGNRPVAEWKGTDPKVWAIIEDRLQHGYTGVAGDVKPASKA
jgi:gluconate 2-dehydrogenase gamma chain